MRFSPNSYIKSTLASNQFTSRSHCCSLAYKKLSQSIFKSKLQPLISQHVTEAVTNLHRNLPKKVIYVRTGHTLTQLFFLSDSQLMSRDEFEEHICFWSSLHIHFIFNRNQPPWLWVQAHMVACDIQGHLWQGPFLLEVNSFPPNSKPKNFFEYISLKYFTTETKFHSSSIPLSRFHRFGNLTADVKVIALISCVIKN